MLNDALKLAKLGIAVFPLSPGSKIPLKGTSGVKDATTDQAKIREWWFNNPKANVGVAMGAISGIVGVDLDANHGATMEDRQRFPRTVTVRTRNGYHLFFKMPVAGIKSQEIIPGRTVGDTESAAYLRSDGYYFVGRGSTVSWDKEKGTLPPFDYEFDSDAGGVLSFDDCPLADFPIELLTAKTPQVGHNLPATTNGPEKKVYGPNTRHAMLTRTAAAMRKRGEPAEKIAEELHKRNQVDCNPPKDTDVINSEVDGIVKWAIENVPVNPEEQKSKVGRPKKERPTPVELADQFLADLNWSDASGDYLRYHRGDFYKFRADHYELVEDEAIDEEINRWLMQTDFYEYAGGEMIKKIVNCIKIKPRFVDRKHDLPCWLNTTEEPKSAKGFIPLKNGIIDVKTYAAGGDINLLPHNHEFFCNYILPYDFDPKATCPTYEKVALEAFGEIEKKLLWEEILGAHLFQPHPIEHFFVLQGEGSNGKSVLVTLLQELLGPQNCSSVPLESFHPENFSFGQTQGKLANIISDQHDIEHINEGLLKQFVTREPMLFNRKFKEPVTARPTAFLTICTNSLPRFMDKSNGVWRRLVLFQFKNEVAPEQQDERLISPEFWRQSGELSGVFNLALAGLMRVIKRGGLNIPHEMHLDASKHRSDLNSIAAFAEECLEVVNDERASSADVYKAYREFTLAQGMKPFNAKFFASRLPVELARISKLNKVQLSVKNERLGTYVGRIWKGVKVIHNAYSQATPKDTQESAPIF